jgi:hypothetical protein
MRFRLFLVIVAASFLATATVLAGSGKLYVTCNVKAKVILNDKEIGETGKLIKDVPAGKITIKVEAEGCLPHTQEITIEENKINKIKVELKYAKVKVDIITEPEGATVYIDGEKQREKTPCTIKVQKGVHDVVIAKGGFKDVVMKKHELKGGDAIEVELKKGKRKYFSQAEKKLIALEKANAKKGIFTTDFEYDDLPGWLELVTSGGGAGRIENGTYILDMPEEDSSAVLRFGKAFPWKNHFTISIRFSLPSKEKAAEFGIVRLDAGSKPLDRIRDEDPKKGCMGWVVELVKKRDRFAVKRRLIQPGGGWKGKTKPGFSFSSRGNTDAPYGEYLCLEMKSSDRGLTFRLTNEKEDGISTDGPYPLDKLKTDFPRMRYWLSFGDLDAAALSGRIVIDYIRIKTAPGRKR